MTYRFIIFPSLFASIALFLSGCGGEKLPPGMPKLYPATVTVTQDGNPLAGAEVILINVEPSERNWSTGGTTDANGVIRLRTLGRYTGAPIGTYLVAVSKIEAPDINLPSETPDDPEERREHNRLVREIAENTFYVVDPKFGLGRTELTVEVTPSNLSHTIDVSPAVRIRVPTGP